MMRLLLSLLLLLSFLQMNAQTYPKVILPGDYPDPSIMRDGKDYYMTHSPFYYAPGFLIWHSQDLMNWEPLCRVMPQYEGSAMAPDLLKYKDTYYIYYPAAGTNWVMWAKNIRGPWSRPVDLKVGGIDPGHVVDKEGNRYLYLDKGEMIRLTEDGLATVGEKKKVYDGWKYPDHWDTECMCLESPKLNEHNGYYYLTSAQGGTAGPATSHMVVSARSKSVTGPWENSPYNPIVHTYSVTDSWWSKGHGTLIDDVNGNWWIVYHAYANDYHTLGRSTLIEPVEWTEDGWYRTVSAATPVTPEQEIPTPGTLEYRRTGSTRRYHPGYECKWATNTVVHILENREYMGCLVNFKTEKPSYKTKHSIENPIEKQAVFENHHEPIIDTQTWERVQELRKQRKRPNRYDEVGLFSGMLFCADCGSVMYQQRYQTDKRKQDCYICGNYKKRTHDCTAHFIRTDLLTAGVLSNLRKVTSYAAKHEARFMKLLIEQNEDGGKRRNAAKKKELEAAEKRIGELSAIFKRLYEDSVSGRISDERFTELSADYEAEQQELKERVARIQAELSKAQEATVNAEKFMNIVRKHMNFEELTHTLLREFVEKIVVHECSYDENGTRRQDIEIYYSFVGKVDLPE